MALNVRKARPDDAGQLAVVHVAAWQAAYATQVPDDYLAGLSTDMQRRIEGWRRRLEETGNTCLVAVDDEAGELYGFTQFGAYRDGGLADTTGELWVINLRPDAWGKGIGAVLFQAGVDGLREQGYHDAVLWVLSGNARARRFYEKHGWQADGHTKTDDRGSFELHEIRYATSLRSPR